MAETRLNEALSALMDGEVDELELRRILRELPANPEFYAAWKRYHVLRASLNQETHVNPRVDLLAGIHARLAADLSEGGIQGDGAAFVRQGGRKKASVARLLQSRVVRYLGQGAIAASVALAALMGVSTLQVSDQSTPNTSTLAVADAGATPALNGEFTASEQVRTVAFDAEAYNRLQQAVYREFSAAPQAIPVRYNPEFPVELSPTE